MVQALPRTASVRGPGFVHFCIISALGNQLIQMPRHILVSVLSDSSDHDSSSSIRRSRSPLPQRISSSSHPEHGTGKSSRTAQAKHGATSLAQAQSISAPVGLPEGWTQHWSAEYGIPFYWHQPGGISSWTRPVHQPGVRQEDRTGNAAQPLAPGWVKCFSQEWGIPYYWNTSSGASAWELLETKQVHQPGVWQERQF